MSPKLQLLCLLSFICLFVVLTSLSNVQAEGRLISANSGLQKGRNKPSPSPSNRATPSPSPIPTPSPTPLPPVPGDIDRNGIVDIYDFSQVLTDFGLSGQGLASDIDGNNQVDIYDFNIVLTNFGRAS